MSHSGNTATSKLFAFSPLEIKDELEEVCNPFPSLRHNMEAHN